MPLRAERRPRRRTGAARQLASSGPSRRNHERLGDDARLQPSTRRPAAQGHPRPAAASGWPATGRNSWSPTTRRRIGRGDLLFGPNLAERTVLFIRFDARTRQGELEIIEATARSWSTASPVRRRCDLARRLADPPVRQPGGALPLQRGPPRRGTHPHRSLEVRGPDARLRPRSRALDHLNFEVTRGEMLCIIGPSGSGKSTLLAILSGQLRTRTAAASASTASTSTTAASGSCPSSPTCRRKRRSTRNSPCASTSATPSTIRRPAPLPARTRTAGGQHAGRTRPAIDRPPPGRRARRQDASAAANAAASTSASTSAAAPRCSSSTNRSPDSPPRTPNTSPKPCARWPATRSSSPRCTGPAPRCCGCSTRCCCSTAADASPSSARRPAMIDYFREACEELGIPHPAVAGASPARRGLRLRRAGNPAQRDRRRPEPGAARRFPATFWQERFESARP